MKVSKVILRTLFSYMLVSMASCVHENVPDNYRLSGVSVEFSITTRNSEEIYSRATEAGEEMLNENRIDKLNLFFCKSDGSIYWYVEDPYVTIEAGVDTYTKKIRIDVPLTRKSNMEANTYNLYAIVNGPARSELATTTTVSALQVLTHTTTSFNHQSTPANFLMDGMVSTGTLSLSNNYTIVTPMALQRAASKIRLLLKEPNVPDFEMIGTPEVRIVNYVDETALLPGAPISTDLSFQGYKNTGYEVMGQIRNTTSGTLEFYTNEHPFYTYENDWKEKAISETRVIIKAIFKSTKTGTPQAEIPYYYSVSINNQLEAGNTKAERNTLYEITADIAKLGSTEENIPVHIESSVKPKPWPVSSEMDGQVVKATYLVVKEKDVIMPNISSREIEYISSSPITILNQIATFTTYDETTGAPIMGNLPVVPPSVTAITKANDRTYLVINNPVPVNFVPLEIEFDITNGEITEHVKVTQYPPRYVTAFPGVKGQNYYKGDALDLSAHHNNSSLFRITTLVNNADVTISGVVCLIGDAQNRESNTRTGIDLNSNRLISPDFIIASQNGVSPLLYLDRTIYITRYHESAENRCYNYYEQDYGPTRAKGGRWRIPTRAEIAYIDALQDNPNSAVKSLLIGTAYWSAQRYYYYNFNVPGGSWSSSYSDNTAYVRCVYDMYKLTTP
jgi:hypothetical protein